MKEVFVKDAPKAIGPYCHAMKVGNLLFCSGQTPLDPETMEIVGNNIKDISIVLAEENLNLNNIVKTTVYLKDMNDFEGMNKVYAEIFNGHKPARTTISIKQNPLDALVEVECIAELNV